MRKYRIDWSREIREFIEERIRTLELLKLLKSMEGRAKRRRTRVDSAELITEARKEH